MGELALDFEFVLVGGVKVLENFHHQFIQLETLFNQFLDAFEILLSLVLLRLIDLTQRELEFLVLQSSQCPLAPDVDAVRVGLVEYQPDFLKI